MKYNAEQITFMLAEAIDQDREYKSWHVSTRHLMALVERVVAEERERFTDAAMKAAEKGIDTAIALEREACAKVCESMNKYMDDGEECATAIRARGNS
jgi:hypothetical protein